MQTKVFPARLIIVLSLEECLRIVSKKKFDMLIKQKLFVPLGMTRSSFTNLNGGPINPSGGAQSTADDYMKFLQMLFQKGKYNGKQILSEEAVEEIADQQGRPLFGFKTGRRLDLLQVFEDEAAGAGEEFLQ